MRVEAMGVGVAESASKGAHDAARERFEVGRAAWPRVCLDLASFERYFFRHAVDEGAPGAEHAVDMYLACACAEGTAGAVAAFERTYAGDMARATASIDSSLAFIEEVRQTTHERLLVRAGDEPAKIAEYAGRSSLKGWLRTVVLRTALGLRRRRCERLHQPFADDEDQRLTAGGPEFDYLRRRYKDTFEDAVRVAVERLPSRQRLLLRLNLVDGMSIDTLGLAYQVGRSTAARWLEAARRALLREARLEVRTRLRLTSTELDSLAADVQSVLEVNIATLLACAGSLEVRAARDP